MAFEIIDWNLNPNILWYVKLRDTGSTFIVELFLTKADADAGTNIIAWQDGLSFGSDIPVLFGNLPDPVVISPSKFNEELSYQIKVSATDGSATRIFKVSPFVDLPDVNNSIYRSESLIQQRAIHEINEHTHVREIHDVGSPNHIPAIKSGEVCRINSTRLGIDVLTTIEELTIVGTKESLINQISTVAYTDLSYD